MNRNGGYIKVHRQILEWEWYADANTMRLFIHCIIKANHAEAKWQGITIPRGSFVTSYPSLAKDLRLSVKQIRIALNHLKTTGETAVKTTSKYSIISIINYEDYQQDGTQKGSQGAGRGQAKGRQRATNKNNKNDNNNKNDKKEIYIVGPDSPDDAEPGLIPANKTAIDYAVIVNYLNERAGTAYKSTSKKTQELIRARIKEGFKESDFFAVITKKSYEWKNNPHMSAYLRPETLFGTKFESYLNQPIKQKTIDDIVIPDHDGPHPDF